MTKPNFILPFLIFLLLLPIFSLCQSKKLVRKGLKSKNIEDQITLFSKAIEEDSKNLDAYFYRGVAKANLGDNTGAILDFTAAIFYDPTANTYFYRGNSKFALGDMQGAYDDYKKAIGKNIRFIEAYYGLGLTQYNLGKKKEALASFKMLLHYNYPMAYTEIAKIYMDLGYPRNAFLNFNRSIQLDTNSYSLFHRGMAYLDMKKYKEAAKDLAVALELDKTNGSAYFYLGITQLFTRRYNEASLNFKKALEFNSLDHEALIGLSIAYYHTNQFEKAKKYFRKAKNVLTFDLEEKSNISQITDESWRLGKVNLLQMYYNRLDTL